MELALRDPLALHLEIGEPDAYAPSHAVEAAAAACRAGLTGYTSSQGMPELREVVAAHVAATTGRACAPDDVVITHGAMNGLSLAMGALLSPGEEVLLPDPEFPNWRMAAMIAGARVGSYPTSAAAGFVPDPDVVEAAITPATRALLICSPNNPTGAVYPPEVLEALVEVATRHDLWVLSDECYDAITFDSPHVSPRTFDVDGRVLVFRSMSKTYAMTGWRLGYAAVPDPAAAELMAHLAEGTVACASTVSQHAALAAMTGPQDEVAVAVRSYRDRRDAATELLGRRGVTCVRPAGAFYLMVDVEDEDTDAFALRLLERRHVAVAPGSTFGPGAAGMVRVALAAERGELLDGLTRLADQIEEDRAARLASGAVPAGDWSPQPTGVAPS
ncbi:MAG: pyridoxal phosphate-dependent aminotransferase [Actinobacteria bacterium]|nr:pyridoxal phosphate-dependent aminotransferase [Actinomycetota bacterium]